MVLAVQCNNADGVYEPDVAQHCAQGEPRGTHQITATQSKKINELHRFDKLFSAEQSFLQYDGKFIPQCEQVCLAEIRISHFSFCFGLLLQLQLLDVAGSVLRHSTVS